MLVSASWLPGFPLKYLDTTTLTAISDQKEGASTPACSKTTSPSLFRITADRLAPLDRIQRVLPGLGKKRANFNPSVRFFRSRRTLRSAVCVTGLSGLDISHLQMAFFGRGFFRQFQTAPHHTFIDNIFIHGGRGLSLNQGES